MFSAYALKCYICETTTHEDCKDPFDIIQTSTFADECKDPWEVCLKQKRTDSCNYYILIIMYSSLCSIHF